MTLKEYYSKNKHTRKENKWYEKEMRKKYEKYKKAYHEAKIEYRTRTTYKYDYKEFKSSYKEVYIRTDGKQTMKAFTTKAKFATLSEDSYEVKRQNLIINQAKYKAKLDSGLPLTPGEELVLKVKPDGNIHKIVGYFDRLGLNHIAFDSI